jgi:protein ImuB
MRAPKTFLKLLTLDVDMHPPPAPVAGVALRFEPVNPRVVQHGLFLPPSPEPQKLELTLARIMKLVEEGNAGAAELLDTYRPGAFRMKKFVGQAISPALGRRQRLPHLVMRMFRPPLRARVQAPQGHPARVAARGVRGSVVALAGPWRTSGDWWRADFWSRDEWDVALSDGALYRVYRDRVKDEWFVEGAYD